MRVAENDWFEARFRPRAVLRRLLGEDDYEQRAVALIDRLDETALKRMRRHPVVREIEEFLPEVQKPSAWGVCVRRAG
jgi:predicted NACHT family NTPase